MFKPGDKIVFVDDYSLFEDEQNYLNELTLNHIYTVKDEVATSVFMPGHIAKQSVHLVETDNIYYTYRFVSLKDFRKRKLRKISKSNELN